MSTYKIIEIIDNLQEKLKGNKPINMNFNNISNNFQNFNNDINFRQFDKTQNQDSIFNNDIKFKSQNNLNENYIKKMIRDEFSRLILPFQQDISGRIGVLELKVNKIDYKKNNLKELNSKDLKINLNMENNEMKDDYKNKISEIEYKLSEIESFFKSWKELVIKSDENLNKYYKEKELKFMQFETKINDEMSKFYNIINNDINNIKKTLNQAKDNEVKINKLEGEIKNMKIDFDYINKDINNMKSFFNSELKKDLNNINQRNINFINDINILKTNVEKINMANNNFKSDIDNIKNDIKVFEIINAKNKIKVSKITNVEQINSDEENSDNNINTNINNNHINSNNINNHNEE